MFGWDLALLVNLYSDVFNFAVGCYITQVQDKEIRLLVYNSFTLFPDERNYDTYQQKLVTIVRFAKKYSHILNIEQWSII